MESKTRIWKMCENLAGMRGACRNVRRSSGGQTSLSSASARISLSWLVFWSGKEAECRKRTDSFLRAMMKYLSHLRWHYRQVFKRPASHKWMNWINIRLDGTCKQHASSEHLSQDAAGSPHVYGLGVVVGRQEQTGGAIPLSYQRLRQVALQEQVQGASQVKKKGRKKAEIDWWLCNTVAHSYICSIC